MNARHLLILTIFPFLISGCAFPSFFKKQVKEIEVKTQEVKRTHLNIKQPKPLSPGSATERLANVLEVDEYSTGEKVQP